MPSDQKVPCKFCGKPLESELACPYLESYDPNPPTPASSVATFTRPIVKVRLDGAVEWRCR